jgi:predicted Zn-dependent peptidase
VSVFREVMEGKLSNGIKVYTEEMEGLSSASIGIWVDVGSRDEAPEYRGCSHFLEHLLFKGTEKRTAAEISTIIEARGGYLNAFTDRDMTCFHSKVLRQDIELAVDVLTDIVQRPLLKEEDISKELNVILSEIDNRDDDPGDLIHDLYFETAWGRNKAAHPILGERTTLCSLEKQAIRDYYSTNYVQSRMIVTAAGSIKHDEFMATLEKYLQIDRPPAKSARSKPHYYVKRRHIPRASSQVQVALTTEGLPYLDRGRDALGIINSYLGVGASSKLFQEVREKQGLVYSVFTSNYSLTDSGLFAVIAGTQDKYVEKLLKTVLKELSALQAGMPEKMLEEIKHKTTGLFVLRSESSESRMTQLGVSALRQGRPKTMKAVIDGINSVDAETVRDLGFKTFQKDRLGLTTLGLSKETERKVEGLFSP